MYYIYLPKLFEHKNCPSYQISLHNHARWILILLRFEFWSIYAIWYNLEHSTLKEIVNGKIDILTNKRYIKNLLEISKFKLSFIKKSILKKRTQVVRAFSNDLDRISLKRQIYYIVQRKIKELATSQNVISTKWNLFSLMCPTLSW